ncbi:zinc finger MYM-type protein 1-like, partial [Trifolium medium]|nr:zinc finger MYM-type protein 1-like [Trifolium medium]
QGLAFRGHDESVDSKNKVAPAIQKDIVAAAACETTRLIVDDVRDDFFSILIDESRDISIKEQMSVVLRYVDKKGSVIERFLGLVRVTNTSAISLKLALESLFAKHNLSLSRVRGQGYDGASNMQGEFNGLKSLILKESKSAFYVHCFAHQLQLALVAVANRQTDVGCFLSSVNKVSNLVGASCKRQEILRESQTLNVYEALKNGEIASGSGLNQNTALKRAGDTRWGSHFGTLLSLISLFKSVIDVLEYIEECGELMLVIY